MNDVVRDIPRTPLKDRLTRDEWRRMAAMFGFIAFLHIAGALLMWRATSGNYELADGSLFGWGTAALAYTLGMRHAFDADDIAQRRIEATPPGFGMGRDERVGLHCHRCFARTDIHAAAFVLGPVGAVGRIGEPRRMHRD